MSNNLGPVDPFLSSYVPRATDFFIFFTCEADGAFSLSPSLQRNAPISCIYIYNEPDL